MSDQNEQNPVDNIPDDANLEDGVDNTPNTDTFIIKGIPTTVLIEQRAKRGGGGEKVTSYIPKFDTFESFNTWLVNLTGSPEKALAVVVRDVVKPMGHDASSASIVNGEVSEAKYSESCEEQCQPASRRKGGPSANEIKERLANIAPELTMLTGVFMQNNGKFVDTDEATAEEQTNRLQVVMLEMKTLSKQLSDKDKGAVVRKEKKNNRIKEKAAKLLAKDKDGVVTPAGSAANSKLPEPVEIKG